jgi:hypothetical protein
LVFEPVGDADGAGFVCHNLKLSGGGASGGNFGASSSVNTKVVSLQLLIVTDTLALSVWPCAARVQAAASVAIASRFAGKRDFIRFLRCMGLTNKPAE